MKFRNFIIISLCLLIPTSLLADEISDRDVDNFVYLFHLYYDQGKLTADRDFKFPYDLVAESFQPELVATEKAYQGKIISLQGNVSATFNFDPIRDKPNFTKGKISVKGPYVADAKLIEFYNPQDQLLLTISLEDTSICNDNNICEAGEDSKTCPLDCATTTLTPLPSVSELPDELPRDNTSLRSAILYTLAGILLIGSWLGWRWWRKRKMSV